MSRDWYRARSLFMLGSATSEVRRQADLTQTEMARRVQSSRPTVSRLERGDAVSTQTVLDVLAEAGYELVVVPRGARVRIEGA